MRNFLYFRDKFETDLEGTNDVSEIRKITVKPEILRTHKTTTV